MCRGDGCVLLQSRDAHLSQVVLFERVTFLVIAQCSRKQVRAALHASHASHASRFTQHHDVHRFEKISNIIKQFKLSCGRSQSQPLSMHISNSTFSAFVGSFTSNTAIMVVSTDPDVRVAST
jgi:Ras-related GTP-binding protein A/B